MPGFADIIRDGVALANSITQTIQPSITIRRWIGTDEFGAASYDDANILTVSALVDKKNQAVAGQDGQEVLAKTYIGILQPIAPVDPLLMVPGHTRSGPIDENDIITLPDGTTGPILNISGFIDKDTSRPYLSEVWLG